MNRNNIANSSTSTCSRTTQDITMKYSDCSLERNSDKAPNGFSSCYLPVSYLRQFKYRLRPVYLLCFVICTLVDNHSVIAQLEQGHKDQVYPERLLFTSQDTDSIQKNPFITRRAMIRVHGRDQDRFLTVFRSSKQGHLEFGFPPEESRASGSLELYDVSKISAGCCSNGVRMVAFRHACSGAYLAIDRFGQLRACRLGSHESQSSRMTSYTHCLDAEKIHTCQRLPYVFLDPVDGSQSGTDGTRHEDAKTKHYKIRFLVKRNKKSVISHVFYALVVPSTWEIKLRSQLSVIRGAMLNAAQNLWVASLKALFRPSVLNYEIANRKRSPRRKLCDVDPAVVRDDVISNASTELFRAHLDKTWHQNSNARFLASTVAWSRMTEFNKDIFTAIVTKSVMLMLKSSLLRIAEFHCLRKTHWGQLTRTEKISHLERYLTLAWLHRKTVAKSLVATSVQQYFNSRVTTFLIREEG